MPDEGKGKSYPILEHMSVEELESLLAQDFTAFDDAEPDIDYIMAVMEVIKKKESENPQAEQINLDAAWKDFRENYQGHADAFEPGRLQEPDSSHLRQIKKKHRPLRIAAIVAVLIVVLCGAASAFGIEILQAIANWGAETFGFEPPFSVTQNVDANPALQNDPLKSIRAAVADHTDIAVIPTWSPDGTERVGDINVAEYINSDSIQGTYLTVDGQFTIRIKIYNDIPENYSGTYQKDGSEVHEYDVGGVTHYILKNLEILQATWTIENVEVQIQGDLSMEDLKEMVDSIYEE